MSKEGGGLRIGWFIAALVIAEISSSLQVTMVYTAMPALTRAYDDPAAVGWIITACLLVGAAAAALCGRLGDLYGHKIVLQIVLATCVAGSLISALSENLGAIILGAGLQGASGAILPLCLALIRVHMDAQRVPTMIGWVLASATGAAAGGLALGGFLVDWGGWSYIFFASGFWAAAGLLAISLFVPQSRGSEAERGRVDMLQGVLFVPALTAFLLSLTLAKTQGFLSPWPASLFLGSILTLAYWIRHQLRQSTPLIHLRAFKDRRIATSYFCIAMVGAGMTQHSLIMTMLLQQKSPAIGFALTAAAAGWLLMPVRLVGIASSAWCGRLIAKHGGRYGLVIGSLLATSGWVLILLFWNSLPAVMVGMLLEGAGYLVCYVAVPSILLAASPPERAGQVTGLSTVFRAAFSAIGAQIVMLLLATSPDNVATKQMPSIEGFTMGFVFILLACAACVAGAVSLPRDMKKVPDQRDPSTGKIGMQPEPRLAPQSDAAR